MIKMANGSTKVITKVKKGELIATPKGSAKVNCVVEFACQNQKAKLCRIGGIKITHHHPIQVEGSWILPSDIVVAEEVDCSAVYNMIVDQTHIAIVNDVPVILLGHNYTTGVLKNEYLGS
jgi:hypothetical protein